MSLRIRPSGAMAPTLRLRVILREDSEDGRYWLCVQPVCDSVRLLGATRFPMLRLEKWPHTETGRRFQLVVPGGGSDALPVHLWIALKPSDVHQMVFTPAADPEVPFAEGEAAPSQCKHNEARAWCGSRS